MTMDRRALIGGSALVAFVAASYGLARTALDGSFHGVAAVGACLLLMEVTALGLACAAFWRNRKSRRGWIWALLGLWVAANLFGDLTWSWYELILRVQPPVPSVADAGYLISYPIGFATIVLAGWKACGRLKATEAALDAAIFTVGATGLAWPWLLAPLLHASGPGLERIVNLAYPLGDVLIVIAFASLLLGSCNVRPPRFVVVVWVTFLLQVAADSAYFVIFAKTGGYQSGGIPDLLWALAFALAGLAALMGLYPERGALGATNGRTWAETDVIPQPERAGYSRILLPYVALPLVGTLIWMHFSWYGLQWTNESRALIYLGIGLVVLLVIRQYVTLLHNDRLNGDLSNLSKELSDRVRILADLTKRLRELNARASHLNSLRTLEEVMQSGIELARSVTGSSAAWMTLKEDNGHERITAALGPPELVPEVGSAAPATTLGKRVQEVRLKARGEEIGSLWLVDSAPEETGFDVMLAVAAHVATAVDNVRRYEEVLRLAERDTLTGLLNHGGIHARLADEASRAQHLQGRLAVVMIDLDDFKLLNDTYGHPTGDRVLTQVSDTIRRVLRHNDLAGRVGGDEMMLVLPDTDRAGAVRLAERLREELTSRLFDTGKAQPIPLRVSFGVAAFPEDATSASQLVARADANLYASKQRGGGIVTEAELHDDSPAEAQGLRGLAGRLMDVMGAKDHYTRRHSDQVVLHALRLGQLVGLSEDSLETLRLAAMLHDIGKVGVQTRVLRKPGPLNRDEERAVRRHVNLGESIIRDLPRVAQVLEVVGAHHERHDGTGYPHGLRGDDIPLLARILAVADAYSAMVVDRPYRGKLTVAEAKAELKKVAGAQLDPELVDCFVHDLADDEATHLAAAG